MTDYFYQVKARRRIPGDGDRPESAAPEDGSWPPEDEAYWAEANPADAAPSADEPLWYEDRLRLSSTMLGAEDAGDAAYGPEDAAGETRALALREAQDAWAEGLAEGDWTDQADDTGTAIQPRAYVPGGQAAMARAAASSGERNIRFDPTKERGQRYYDKATSHSRHVRLLKIGLPAVALLAVAGFLVVMNTGEKGDGLPPLTLSGINLDTREITMDKPHISGFEGTTRAYEVTAAKAVQALGNPKVVDLDAIDARFAVSDDVRAHLIATAGVYDADTQLLQLRDGIDVTTDNGYAGKLTAARVDIAKGSIFSDTGVTLAGKEGSITAAGMEVFDRGKRIVFRGGVKVHLEPPEEREAAATDAHDTPAATQITDREPDGPT